MHTFGSPSDRSDVNQGKKDAEEQKEKLEIMFRFFAITSRECVPRMTPYRRQEEEPQKMWKKEQLYSTWLSIIGSAPTPLALSFCFSHRQRESKGLSNDYHFSFDFFRVSVRHTRTRLLLVRIECAVMRLLGLSPLLSMLFNNLNWAEKYTEGWIALSSPARRGRSARSAETKNTRIHLMQ